MDAAFQNVMNPFGNQLSEKTVMMQDGTQVGSIHNVTADMKTGELLSLIVEPVQYEHQKPIPFETGRAGRFIVPASTVAAIEDYVILSA
jgi:sporulation protein YlmC with PRC-barrel domain